MSEQSMAMVPMNEQQDISVQWTQDDLQALKATVAKDCDASQFKVFVAAAKRLQLDPFARQIVPIVQGGKMTPQTTIDGFRLIAERTRKYAGQIGPFWCGPDGDWREVWTDDALPMACKIGVIRRDFAQPLYDVAHMRSYRKETPTWKQLPIEMLAKVAEARALRRAFPQELSGVYTEDEMTVDADPAHGTVADARPTQQERNAAQRNCTPALDWASLKTRAAALGLKNFSAFAKATIGKDKPDYSQAEYTTIERELTKREQAPKRPTITEEKPDIAFQAEDNSGDYDLRELPTDTLKVS